MSRVKSLIAQRSVIRLFIWFRSELGRMSTSGLSIFARRVSLCSLSLARKYARALVHSSLLLLLMSSQQIAACPWW